MINYRYTTISAPKLAYFYTFGIMPESGYVAQKCGNNLCCNPNHIVITLSLSISRFWEKVKKTETCWLWVGKVSNKGYGVVHIGQKVASAHRVSYEIEKGLISEGLEIRHTCDTPLCVNPDHLLIGTHADNMHDMVERNRSKRGEAQRVAKLTEAQVIAIRLEYKETKPTYSILAEKYNVSISAILAVVRGLSWKHLLPTSEDKND